MTSISVRPQPDASRRGREVRRRPGEAGRLAALDASWRQKNDAAPFGDQTADRQGMPPFGPGFWPGSAFPDEVSDRRFISLQATLSAIRDHLAAAEPEDRPYLHYFTLTHLHNNPNVSEESLRLRGRPWPRWSTASAGSRASNRPVPSIRNRLCSPSTCGLRLGPRRPVGRGDGRLPLRPHV